MYGYISKENVVVQLFEEVPTNDMYHPEYLARVTLIPEGTLSGWIYDPTTKSFSQPGSPEPAAEETMLELLADQEYRLCMIEMGLT